MSKVGGSSRKLGRSKKTTWYKIYTIENRAEKNKKKRIARHLKRHPNDAQAVGTVPNYTRRA